MKPNFPAVFLFWTLLTNCIQVLSSMTSVPCVRIVDIRKFSAILDDIGSVYIYRFPWYTDSYIAIEGYLNGVIYFLSFQWSSSLFLNTPVEGASTTYSGKLFQSVTILLEKALVLTNFVACCLNNLYLCPLVVTLPILNSCSPFIFN